MVMDQKPARVLALAFASLVAIPNIPFAGEGFISPRHLSADVVEERANKTECVVPSSIAVKMQSGQVFLGGRIIALVDGADQSFADRWRLFTRQDSVDVSLIMAHGFASPITGRTVLDVVEFDESGCAFSRTLISGEAWDIIVGSLAAAAKGFDI
jgi:hypothetical protein